MKKFFIWLSAFLIVNASLIVATHFYMLSNPNKILFAIDTSYNMKSVWNKVLKELDRYNNKRYTKYSLITDKILIHSWEDNLLVDKISNLKVYGPREIEQFYDSNKYKELKEANVIYIITNDNNVKAKNKKYKIIIIKD